MIDFTLDDKITAYEPMMKTLCLRVLGQVNQEYLQDCRIATYEAIQNYDKTKGTKESTFVYNVIRCNLITLKNQFKQFKNQKRLSLNQISDNGDDEITELIEIIQDKKIKNAFQNLCEKEIVDFLEEIVNAYINRQVKFRMPDKTKNNLIDTFVKGYEPKYLKNKYGYKYDNPTKYFRKYIKERIPKRIIDRITKERDKWVQKERSLPENKRISHRRSLKTNQQGQKYYINKD